MSWWSRTPWWVRTLAGIGAYATAVELLKRTVDLGRRRSSPRAGELPRPGTAEFVRMLARSLGTPHGTGGEAQLLSNGEEFFPALLEAAAGAKHHIHLMTYIWEDGEVSDRLIDVLVEKAKQGVEIRILVDGIGARRLPSRRLKRLSELGADVFIYSRVLSADLIHLNRRNHRRAMVVDGRIGFTGGVSISDKWMGSGERPDRFRDVMICARGRMAHVIQFMFLQLWANNRAEELVSAAYFPESDRAGGDGETVAMGETIGPASGSDAQLHYLGLAQTPAMRIQPVHRLYWLSFKAARERIWVSSGYFAPSAPIRRVLREKARAGLDVRLLLPGQHGDNPAVRWSARLRYGGYLDAGIRIFEYQPGMLHAKHILVDDEWTMVGSADVGVRAFKINHEGVLGIASFDIGRRAREEFERDFERSHEIRREEWDDRSVLRRVRQRASALLHAQY